MQRVLMLRKQFGGVIVGIVLACLAARLVLRDAETGIEQQSVEVIIDRAFTDDF